MAPPSGRYMPTASRAVVGLAAARFAHQAVGLARRNAQAHLAHRVHVAAGGGEVARLQRKPLADRLQGQHAVSSGAAAAARLGLTAAEPLRPRTVEGRCATAVPSAAGAGSWARADSEARDSRLLGRAPCGGAAAAVVPAARCTGVQELMRPSFRVRNLLPGVPGQHGVSGAAAAALGLAPGSTQRWWMMPAGRRPVSGGRRPGAARHGRGHRFMVRGGVRLFVDQWRYGAGAAGFRDRAARGERAARLRVQGVGHVAGDGVQRLLGV